jgi:DNA-binding CsgD family transcriptional regulator
MPAPPVVRREETMTHHPGAPHGAAPLRRQGDAGADGVTRRRTLAEDAAAPWREMLDHIDLGVLLVDVQGQVLAANLAGRLACSGPEAPLHLWNGLLHPAVAQDHDALRRALSAAAHRGLRTLLRLGPAGHARHLTLLPLRRAAAGPQTPSPVQILFDRQPADGGLALESFAQLTGLTPAEATVLQMLCAGVRPDDIARRGGVAISTVRTQLAAIRQKTQSGTLRELVRRIGHLPPVMPALRRVPESRLHPRRAQDPEPAPG